MKIVKSELLLSFEIKAKRYLSPMEMKQLCIFISKNWRLQNFEKSRWAGLFWMEFPPYLKAKVPERWYVLVSPSVAGGLGASIALVDAGPKSNGARMVERLGGTIAFWAGQFYAGASGFT